MPRVPANASENDGPAHLLPSKFDTELTRGAAADPMKLAAACPAADTAFTTIRFRRCPRASPASTPATLSACVWNRCAVAANWRRRFVWASR